MTVEQSDGWEVVRRQVALWGRLTSGVTGQAVRDGEVRIVDGPHVHGVVATMRPDGLYFFLDLPPGRYVIAAEDGRGRLRGNATGEVSWDAEGNVRPALVDLELTPPATDRVRRSAVERPRARPPHTHQQRRKPTG